MHDPRTLIYFYGDWADHERATLMESALESTPPDVLHHWNTKLGHLWMLLRHDEGRVSAQMGSERVEAASAEALGALIRTHDWGNANDVWASRRHGRLHR